MDRHKPIPTVMLSLTLALTCFGLSGCDYFFCNDCKLTKEETILVTALNKKYQDFDTLYNDNCLRGYFHVYLKSDYNGAMTDTLVQNVLADLRQNSMDRHVWLFDNHKKFIYRLSFYDNNFVKRDNQYIDQ